MKPYTVADVIAPLLQDGPFDDFTKLWEAARLWPPDAFAIAYFLLCHNALYRCAVSTDEIDGHAAPDEAAHDMAALWPNQQAFVEYVRAIGARWRRFADARIQEKAPPDDPMLERFFQTVATDIASLLSCPRGFKGASRASLATLFCLFAAADEACIGVGFPGAAVGGATGFDFVANMLLVDPDHASLARFPSHIVRVLPKSHTPQRGMTSRSLSHHVGATTQDFGVTWDLPTRSLAQNLDERLNLLLLPWPLSVDDRAVRPAESSSLPDGWGYFDFVPPDPLDVDAVRDLVRAAKAKRLSVDAVVMPEACVTEQEADALLKVLSDEEVALLLVGVRGDRMNAAWLYRDGVPYKQDKHHRWCLDRAQIERYGFQRSLNPHVNWWENIKLAQRKLRFVAIDSWLTLCHVICEDLARLDPVDQLIRSVGPNLLIALLQDGPQLEFRWGARYATVYSDDPGTSVLTLTSLGMALASRPPAGKLPSRCVALWSDPDKGTTELTLAPDHEAIWLSVCGRRVTEFTADGRSDGGMTSRLVLVDHQSVRR